MTYFNDNNAPASEPPVLSSASDDIHFLAVDASTGKPFHEPISRFQVPTMPTGDRGTRPGVDSTDLSSAGWGVVFPRAIDPSIKEALKPLLSWRREQAGARYRELTYLPREGPGVFRSRLRSAPGSVSSDSMPFYLLLVGDPTAIPHGFEFDIGLQFATGRLALPSPEAYAAYAQNVVAWERDSQPLSTTKLSIFAPKHPGDPATVITRKHLVAPLLDRLSSSSRFSTSRPTSSSRPNVSISTATSHVNIDAQVGAAAHKQALAEILTDTSTSMIFVAGHAVLFKSDHSRQQPCQGALVCADWPGGRAATPNDYFAASDLPADGDYRGKICVFFGCHTAGTPRFDSYDFGLPVEKRRRLAPRPFVAQLPQALLSHPGGSALAIVAHVDRAFPSHRFSKHTDYQVDCFEDLLTETLRGEPLGAAAATFGQRHADLAAQLVASQLSPGDDDLTHLDAGDLWRAYNDARSHVILGDPAVQLTAG